MGERGAPTKQNWTNTLFQLPDFTQNMFGQWKGFEYMVFLNGMMEVCRKFIN